MYRKTESSDDATNVLQHVTISHFERLRDSYRYSRVTNHEITNHWVEYEVFVCLREALTIPAVKFSIQHLLCTRQYAEDRFPEQIISR